MHGERISEDSSGQRLWRVDRVLPCSDMIYYGSDTPVGPSYVDLCRLMDIRKRVIG
jgi:hypothetical protein